MFECGADFQKKIRILRASGKNLPVRTAPFTALRRSRRFAKLK
jgi:hypothetical protein